jgi:uncharacterized protein YjgD (DUF1641 family)
MCEKTIEKIADKTAKNLVENNTVLISLGRNTGKQLLHKKIFDKLLELREIDKIKNLYL